MTKKLLTYLLLLVGAHVFAQNPNTAEKLFMDGDYAKAYKQYALLYRSSPNTPLYAYRLARCEHELGMIHEAIEHFEKAGDRYALRHLYLGELYNQTYRFAEAITMYNKYLATIENTHERYEYVTNQIRQCERADRLMGRVEDVQIIDSVRFAQEELAHYVVLSEGQGEIAFEGDSYTFTTARGDRRYFTVKDSLSGTSKICCQQRLLDDWSAADTLPATVNKHARQGYPFLMADGLTLVYAAQAENGLGGWDIYMTRFNPSTGNYLTPEMMGMPYNSPGDDFFYYVDEHAGRGYFFTNRDAGKGQVKRYTFIVENEKKYVRDTTDAYLREYAQLHVLRPLKQFDEKEEAPQEPDETEPVAPVEIMDEMEPEWVIVINDTLRYVHLSDFQQEEARKMAEQYLEMEDDYWSKVMELESKRKQCHAAKQILRAQDNQAEKEKAKTQIDALQPAIMTLENELPKLRKECKGMLKALREAELTGMK